MDDLEKALEEIVRNFLLHETKTTGQTKSKTESNGKNHKEASTVPEVAVPDDEFVAELYQCLTDRGVLREIHALLRQRLVEILKGCYPEVVASGCQDAISGVALRLFEDFLCCHNLLFTYSVLSSETDGKVAKRDFGKLGSAEAESILEEMKIRPNSVLSQKILKLYSEKQNASLLECVLGVTSWGDTKDQWFSPPTKEDPLSSEIGLATADNIPARQSLQNLDGAEERYLQLQILMERDKEAQIKMAIQRFREEETQRIRDELATKLKFDFIAKEKELLRSYDERVAHMKSILDREKEIWAAEKSRKEKELMSQKQDLIKLMEHVKEKKKKLQEALQNIQGSRSKEDQTVAATSEKAGDSSIASEESSSDSNSRKYNLMKSLELESLVRRLQLENARLKGRSQRQPRSDWLRERSSPLSDDNYTSPKRDRVDDDKIALLQYTVEKQTEELENMKRQLRGGYLQPRVNHSLHGTTGEKVHPTRDQDLESFLAESKRRFAEIEKKAEQVGSSLKEVFKRSSASKLSGAGSPLLSLESTVPMVPRIPSILKQSAPSRQTAVATEILGSGLSTSAETLKTFLLEQAAETYTSKLKVTECSHTHLLQKALDPRVVPTSALLTPLPTVTSSVAPMAPAWQPVKPTPSTSTGPSAAAKAPEPPRPPVKSPTTEPSVKPKPSPVISEPIPFGLPPAFSPAIPAASEPAQERESEKVEPEESVLPPSVGELGTSRGFEKSHSSPAKGEVPEADKVSTPSILREATFVVQSKPPDSVIPPTSESVPLPSQRSAPVLAEPSEFKVPTIAGASSSGALIHTKIPSMDAAETQRSDGARADSAVGSGGDALTKTKLPKAGKRNETSSDNSISFPDISHAEGDTFEFMTEEDFWAI